MELKIREVRISKEITLSKLARKSKISKSYLSDLEDPISAKKNPSIETLCKIARALKVDPCDLVDCEYFHKKEGCSLSE